MTKAERETVIVVLDGTKTLTEKNGVVPLRWALKELVETKDLVVVLTILDPGTYPDDSPLNAGCCCGGDDRFEQQHPREGDSYIEFLHEEMRKEPLKHLKHVFGPYRDKCKTIGVKFQVKIAAGSEPEDLVVQEANNIDATWIVVDRCFAQNQSFQLSGTYCKVVLVGGDGDTQSVDTKSNPEEYPKPEERLVSPGESHVHVPRECEKPQNFESLNEIQHQVNMELPGDSIGVNYENISFAGQCNVNLVVRMPLELSWEMVEEITGGFTRMTCIGKNESFKMYHGYLSDHHSQVLVKRFAGEVDHIVKVEKRAALSMYHKNILGLIGYHKSKNGTILVYPFSRRRTLERFIHGSKGKHLRLTFQEKIKIAVGIGQGLRYMHEECPRGPVVHGDLRPCNIFLNYDLEPQITGFGQATWLQLKQGLLISTKRHKDKDSADLESIALVKFDILQFGILLLRLFCRRLAPQDDNVFLEWARPLLLHRVYHKLLDEGVEYSDMYGIFRVISTASQCIKPKPISRPSMTEVISLLKGESSCAMKLSPSSEGSPILDFNLSCVA